MHEHQQKQDPPLGTLWGLPKPTTLPYLTITYIKNDVITDDEGLTHNPSKAIRDLWKSQINIHKINKSTEIAIAANQNKEKISLEELVPKYAAKYSKVFEKHAAERFSLLRPWDYANKFKKEFEQENALKDKQWGRIYPLSLTEKEELCKFINENLAKGFIKRSDSQFASPFFFVSKKDGSLRLVQDYCTLNEVTIKNAYPLPLIDNLFNQLTNATIFTKFDVCAGYNNICIKEGDQHKAAFITPLGLFEPMVMFFGLCNTPTTFQDMMDRVFEDLVREGWLIIYMNDMLIFSNNIEEHRIQTC